MPVSPRVVFLDVAYAPSSLASRAGSVALLGRAIIRSEKLVGQLSTQKYRTFLIDRKDSNDGTLFDGLLGFAIMDEGIPISIRLVGERYG
jgi:hypothetical protein